MARRLPHSLRIAGKLVLVLGLFVLSTLVGVLMILTIPSLRAPLVVFALRELETATGYHATLSIPELDAHGVVIRDVRFWDRARQLRGSVGAIELRYELSRLFAPGPHLDALRIRDVDVLLPPSLFEGDDGAPDEQEDEGGGLPSFSVGSVDVRNVRVHTALGGRALDGQIDRLRGAVRSRDALTVELAEAALSVLGERGFLLLLQHAHGRYDERGESDLRLSGVLGGAPFSLRAQGEAAFDRVPNASATLVLRGLDGTALDRAGLDPSLLKKPTDLTLIATGDGGTARAALTLKAEGALVQLDAGYDQPKLHAALEARGTELASLSSALPSLGIRASLTADADFARATWPVSLQLRRAELDGSPIPDVDVAAQVALPLIRVERLSAPAYGKQLNARGQYDLDGGKADVALSIDGLALAQFAPGVHGKVHGQATFSLSPKELRGAASLSVLDVVSGSARVPELAIDASALGPPSAPVVSASVRGLAVQAGPALLDSVAIDLRGSGKSYDGTLAVRAQKGRADATLAVRQGEELSELHVDGTGQLGARKLRGTIAVAQNDRVMDARLELAGEGDERISLDLAQLPRELSLKLSTSRIPLAPWLAELDVFGVDGELEAALRAHVPRQGGELLSDRASLDGHVTVDGKAADLGVLVPALKHVSADGRVELAVSGEAADPHLGLVLVARGERDGAVRRSSDSARFVVRAHKEESAADLTLTDPKGQLLHVNLKTPLGPFALQDALGKQAIPPVDVKLALAQRRLDQQTGLIASLIQQYAGILPVALSGRADVQLRDEALKGMLDLDLTLFGSTLDATCAAGADTKLALHATTERGALSVQLDGHGYAGGELVVKASAPIRGLLPPSGASDAQAMLVGPMEVEASGRELFLPGLPGFCSLSDGKASFSAQIERLGAADMKGKIAGTIEGLRGGKGDAVSARFGAELDPKAVRAESTLLSRGKEVGSLRAALPLVGETMPTGLDLDAPVSASLSLQRLPLGALLSVGDTLGQPSGALDAELRLGGTLHDPDPRGKIRFDDIAISIATLAQPLQHIGGELTFDGRKLLIKGLTARDRDGRVTIQGWLGVDEQRRASGDVYLRSDKFPLRRQGRVAGELTLDARLHMANTPLAAMDAKLTLRGGRLWLGDTSGGDVQSLAENPDVSYVDRPEREPTPAQLPEAGPSVGLAKLAVQTEKELWVMHQDFSVQLGLDLAMVTVDDEPTLKGEAEIHRGNLMLLGRAFDIEKGKILFTGDAPPNPDLDLKATYAPPSGQKLVVTVSGRASEPNVAFSGAATTAAEALAVVSGVSRSRSSGAAEQQAQQDARGFATGLTAGLLSATVRRELGDWVPLISVENDSAGRVSSARAGVDASKLIPRFMRGFAKSAYLEGVVGNSQTRPGGSVGLGVRLELSLPKDFMTSAGYGPGPNWSTDFAWAP